MKLWSSVASWELLFSLFKYMTDEKISSWLRQKGFTDQVMLCTRFKSHSPTLEVETTKWHISLTWTQFSLFVSVSITKGLVVEKAFYITSLMLHWVLWHGVMHNITGVTAGVIRRINTQLCSSDLICINYLTFVSFSLSLLSAVSFSSAFSAEKL